MSGTTLIPRSDENPFAKVQNERKQVVLQADEYTVPILVSLSQRASKLLLLLIIHYDIKQQQSVLPMKTLRSYVAFDTNAVARLLLELHHAGILSRAAKLEHYYLNPAFVRVLTIS